jgi:undecaprenyl-diphosphatase
MELDEQLFLSLNSALSGSGSTFFFTMITKLGNGLLLAVLILIPMVAFDRRQFRKHAIPIILAVALSGLIVNLMKIAVDRPRPKDHFAKTNTAVHTPLGTPHDRSFPSGHTQTAFGAASYISCIYPIASPLFMVLACLVGLSRIAIGVHFPLDVVAGALFGTLFSLAAFFLVKRRSSP